MTFRITGLPAERFQPLFEMTDDELSARNIRRRVADAKPGFPCRVSLEDAEIGEELLLLPFEHQPAASPYRASGPIFVRRAATRTHASVGEVPEQLRTRLLSVRAYDDAGMMVAADVVDGERLRETVERLFTRPEVAYLHVHNAKPGCFACRIDRAA